MNAKYVFWCSIFYQEICYLLFMLRTGQADTEVQIPNTTCTMVDAENNEMPLVKHALEHIPRFYVYFQVYTLK